MEDADDESAAACNILPGLLQSIFGHGLFASEDKSGSSGGISKDMTEGTSQHSTQNALSFANIEKLLDMPVVWRMRTMTNPCKGCL